MLLFLLLGALQIVMRNFDLMKEPQGFERMWKALGMEVCAAAMLQHRFTQVAQIHSVHRVTSDRGIPVTPWGLRS